VTEAEWDVALPVAILAGGLGTRLGSSSANLPKALVPVAGEPFVAHQLRRLRSQGVERVVLLVGYRGEQIRDYIGSGSAFGIDIAYSFDGEKLLGTGGALRAALPLLGPRFGVTYGDSLLNLPIGTMRLAWRRSGLPAMMSVFRNMGRWDTSNVVFADGKLIVYDKRQRRPEMAYIDYGFGLLCEDVLRGHEVGETFDLADVYTDLSKRGRLAGYEVQQRFYEIGTPAGLAETENHIKEGPVETDFTRKYYEEVLAVAQGIDRLAVDRMIDILVETRAGGGRLFILGVGGGAGNAGHAVNDFRKICGIEAYAPTDNVSELTARTNDEGWPTVFAAFLKTSRIGSKDAVLVFSVGGGNAQKNISANIVEALKVAKAAGAKVIGVVGRDGGYTKEVADACVVVPTVNAATVTPHTEAFQAVVWHGMVSHPKLQANDMKWESVR
jgi:D-sedoheptulose 7-phosphate isomerase